jgi:acetyl esterase/lipase
MAKMKLSQFPLLPGVLERTLVSILYGFTYLVLRPIFGPPFPPLWQRRLMRPFAALLPAVDGVSFSTTQLGGVAAEIIEPLHGTANGTLLYLHGGAFLLGGPHSHRALTTRLAVEANTRVVVLDYRLEPEHAYPTALDDCLAAYQTLLAQGMAPSQIVVAGDSAGGALSITLALRLKKLGLPPPAGLLLISPVTGVALDSASHQRYRHRDPMLRAGCLQTVAAIMNRATDADERAPVNANLSGLPPMLIQVGSIEALYDDAVQLAEQASRCGVAVELEVNDGLWHVSQLYAGFLSTAQAATTRLAQRFLQMISS